MFSSAKWSLNAWSFFCIVSMIESHADLVSATACVPLSSVNFVRRAISAFMSATSFAYPVLPAPRGRDGLVLEVLRVLPLALLDFELELQRLRIGLPCRRS